MHTNTLLADAQMSDDVQETQETTTVVGYQLVIEIRCFSNGSHQLEVAERRVLDTIDGVSLDEAKKRYHKSRIHLFDNDEPNSKNQYCIEERRRSGLTRRVSDYM